MDQEGNSVSSPQDISMRDAILTQEQNTGSFSSDLHDFINIQTDAPQKKRISKRLIVVVVAAVVLCAVIAIFLITALSQKSASTLYHEFSDLLLYGPEGKNEENEKAYAGTSYAAIQADKEYIAALEKSWGDFYTKAKSIKATKDYEEYYASVDVGIKNLSVYFNNPLPSTDELFKIYTNDSLDAMMDRINAIRDKFSALKDNEFAPNFVDAYTQLEEKYELLFLRYYLSGCYKDATDKVPDECYAVGDEKVAEAQLDVQEYTHKLSDYVDLTGRTITKKFLMIREQDIIDAEN